VNFVLKLHRFVERCCVLPWRLSYLLVILAWGVPFYLIGVVIRAMVVLMPRVGADPIQHRVYGVVAWPWVVAKDAGYARGGFWRTMGRLLWS
jgi:hypothetical protein